MSNRKIAHRSPACRLVAVATSLLFWSASFAVAGGEQVLELTRDAGAQAIQSAIDQLGDTPATLRLAAERWQIDHSIDIPEHVRLELAAGTLLQLSADITLRIHGEFEVAGLQRVFAGEGQVRFGPRFLQEVYPQWWGNIRGIDDGEACRRAVQSGAKRIRFPAAIYAIDAANTKRPGGSLRPASHTQLLFDHGATLRAVPNGAAHYAVVDLTNVENVVVSGATIVGDRAEHTATHGEWGHGIQIGSGAKNIRIENCTVSDCWGDGIYVGGHKLRGVEVVNSRFDNNRRNACSVTSAQDVRFSRCRFSNTHGTSPGKGVDVEPNRGEDLIRNIVFENCQSANNLTGGFTLAYDGSLDQPATVGFYNCTSENDGYGFGLDLGPSDTAGQLTLRDCTVLNPGEDGFKSAGNLRTVIDGLTVVNPNQLQEKRPTFGHGIALVIWPHRQGIAQAVGNITARNVSIHTGDGKMKTAVYCENRAGPESHFHAVDIRFQTNAPPSRQLHRGAGPFEQGCQIEVLP